MVEENTGYLPVEDHINGIQILATDKLVMAESGYLEIFDFKDRGIDDRPEKMSRDFYRCRGMPHIKVGVQKKLRERGRLHNVCKMWVGG